MWLHRETRQDFLRWELASFTSSQIDFKILFQKYYWCRLTFCVGCIKKVFLLQPILMINLKELVMQTGTSLHSLLLSVFHDCESLVDCVLEVHNSLTAIWVKLLIAISRVYQLVRSWELRTWPLKLNFIDILTASPHYFYKKCMETKKENL